MHICMIITFKNLKTEIQKKIQKVKTLTLEL